MEKRRLAELRVVDLRVELEKRGLDKNGVKAALVERLAQALSSEGHDPETYVFDTAEATAPKRTPVTKRQRRTKDGDAEQEGEEDEEEPESGDSVQHEISETSHDDKVVDDKPVVSTDHVPSMEASDDATIFKMPSQESRIPSPDTVEPQYPFTSEDTIRLHANRQLAADDSSSLFVNTDDGGGSEVDQSENDADADKVSIKTEPSEESVSSMVAESADRIFKQEPMEEKEPPSATDASATENDDKTAGDDAQRSEDVKAVGAEKKTDTPTEKPADKLSKGKDLWISGLASNTRAAEIKTLFSKYGRVTVAKIVQSTKSPGSKCYGMVSMATPEEASKCIQHLHRTELHGRIITVERARGDQLTINAKKDGPSAAAAAAAATQVKKPATSNTMVAVALKIGDSVGAEGTQQGIQAVPIEAVKADMDTKEAVKMASEGDRKSADEKQLKKQPSKEKLTKDTKPKEKHKSRSRSPHRSGDSRDRNRTQRPILSRAPGPRGTRPAPHRPIMSRPPPPLRPPAVHTGRSMYERSLARAAMVRDRAAVLRREREQRERERERERTRQKELDDRLRQKEMEFRQREEKLKLAKEIERLKYEREKLERERLELEQMRMQTVYARDRMPPPAVPVGGLKRPYDGVSSSYTPDAKRGSYGASSSSSYGSRGSGRDRSPPRRESYGSRDSSRSGNRYSGDSRSSERRPPSSSGRSGNHHREDDYHQRRSDSGARVASARSTSSRRVSSPPPRRSRDAPPPPPPPPPRGAPVWSSGSATRHSSSSNRDRESGYGSSNRMGSGGSSSYGSSGRTFSQQSSGSHGAAPWGTGASLSGMPTVAAWARPGPAAPVGSGVWTNIPSNVFPSPMASTTSTGNYNTSADRFDTYGKSYSGSTNRRY